MKLLSWNCQGLGGFEDLTVPRLGYLRKEHFLEILFLMETKHSRNFLVDFQEWLGYDIIYIVEPRGLNGVSSLLKKQCRY